MTTTLNDGFGSHVTATGLGFLLNDEMDDFAAKQGVPNMYGLIQGPDNAIAPGKRPLSAMTPTIVLKDGKLRMVLGSPGGPRIITTVPTSSSAAEGGLNIQQAVDAPRFHHQYLPDNALRRSRLPRRKRREAHAEGYTLKQGGHWSDGECIAVDPKTGKLERPGPPPPLRQGRRLLGTARKTASIFKGGRRAIRCRRGPCLLVGLDQEPVLLHKWKAAIVASVDHLPSSVADFLFDQLVEISLWKRPVSVEKVFVKA